MGSFPRGEYCHRDARNASQVSLVIVQVDMPDMGTAADVNGTGDSGHPASVRGANMVRIDVEAHHAHARFSGIGRTTGAQGLGQHDRNAAVQDPVGLAGALVHWHAGTNEVVANLQKFHTEMARSGVDMAVGQKVDRDGFFPDAHGLRFHGLTEPGPAMITGIPCIWGWRGIV